MEAGVVCRCPVMISGVVVQTGVSIPTSSGMTAHEIGQLELRNFPSNWVLTVYVRVLRWYSAKPLSFRCVVMGFVH